jgi:hypothetical protein
LLAHEDALHHDAQCLACGLVFRPVDSFRNTPRAAPVRRLPVLAEDEEATDRLDALLALAGKRKRLRDQFQAFAVAAARFFSLDTLARFIWGTLFLLLGLIGQTEGARASGVLSTFLLAVVVPLFYTVGLILLVQPLLKASGRWPWG